MRRFLAGIIVPIATVLILSALVSPLVPIQTPINIVARPVEALAPHLLLTGLVLSLSAAALGRPRTGLVLALIAATGGAALGLSHLRQTRPLSDGPADLSVLFLNADWSNSGNADRIVSAVIGAAPDIAVLAEAGAVLPALDRLRKRYAYVSPCTPERCELLFATDLPVSGLLVLPIDPWSLRFARLEVESEDGRRLYVVANHLSKPWDTVLIQPALEQLAAQYRYVDAPLIVVGDFNAPSWSRPLRQLTATTGLTGLRLQFGTWPKFLRALAFPIDQVLVGNGARIVGIRPFGDDLGSNHRGFVADLALPR